MITDTMTWDEVVAYQKKLIERFISNKKILKTIEKRKYNRFRKAVDGIIYNGIQEFDMGNRDKIIMAFYLISKTLEKLHVMFMIFRYKREKYISYYVNEGDVYFFRWHAVKRYFQRFYKEEEPDISKEDIAKMLVYNGVLLSNSYNKEAKDHFNRFYIVRDGIFLGIKGKGWHLIITYVTREMLFANQELQFKEGFKLYKEIMIIDYNIAV